MDTDTIQLIILFLLLLLSGFFSSAETALTTVNKIKMRSLKDKGNKSAGIVIKLIEEPSKMLSTILIGNNIVNISASSLATTYSIHKFGSYGAGIATGILTLLVLIFGEITPKSVASLHADSLALRFAKYIYALSVVLTPVIIVVNFLASNVMRIFGINPNIKKALITESELRTIVDVSHEEGVIESDERKMIKNVVDFGDSVAKDVMVPQIDIAFIDADCTYKELIDSFTKDKFTRMPVFKESKDNIIGIINLKDVFFYDGDEESFNIKDLIRPAYFTYEYKKTSELFKEMKKESMPLAIVLDEYGTTAGLITVEDLLEEIVGEIRDEFDYDEVELIQKVNEKEFLVDGLAKLDDINEKIGLNLHSDDYDSIAGHIINLMEHIPNQGEVIKKDNVEYKVTKLDKNRIEQVKIRLVG
ncbi:MAG: hemolysin family protein [Lachnospiraceae bacterium]|nr:hemolysin family protein [Lachnospiraceae bacterium]